MDHLQKFATQIRRRQATLFLLGNGCMIGIWWYGSQVRGLEAGLLLWILIAAAALLSATFALISTQYLTKPLKIVWQAVMHIAPDAANTPAPNLKSAQFLGAELVTNLVQHIYQLSSVVGNFEKIASKRPHNLRADFVANSLPLPLIVLDKSQTVLFANTAMAEYLGRDASDVIGQDVYSVLDMSFPSNNTLDKWLAHAKANKAVDTTTWERVRLNVQEEGHKAVRQFDLAAYYNKDNPQGFETMLVLFDHSARYGRDDQAFNFIALAVHELRAPITLLRGYVEAFEEELEGELSPELTDFMHKMKASSQRLTTFVNNILNVSRIDNDQLTLKLHEEQWPRVVRAAVRDMELRARVQGAKIDVHIADDLPPVGIDNVSMYEVLNNLIDNAIKYSGDSKKIVVTSKLSGDGTVETTVQDFGIGIPTNIVSNLFEKFYRSYHSKGQVGGTGLGLYLCKAIVEAHGGHIWVRSKEGQGSTFGFTIKPYARLAEEQKSGDNTDIVRNAHGWIKNHSLYRG